jgi:voltage-gated potassium channel
MASDPFHHPEILTPENAAHLAELERLSLRTALRFAKHLCRGIAFLGGIFIFFLLLLAGAALVFMIWEELPLGDAVYFVAITALTIGYGDITPHTVLGSVLAPLVGLTGLLMTGVFIAVTVRALEFTVREELARQHAAGPSSSSNTK